MRNYKNDLNLDIQQEKISENLFRFFFFQIKKSIFPGLVENFEYKINLIEKKKIIIAIIL